MRPSQAALGSVLALLTHPNRSSPAAPAKFAAAPLLIGVLRGWRDGHNVDARVIAQRRQEALHEFACVQGEVARCTCQTSTCRNRAMKIRTGRGSNRCQSPARTCSNGAQPPIGNLIPYPCVLSAA